MSGFRDSDYLLTKFLEGLMEDTSPDAQALKSQIEKETGESFTSVAKKVASVSIPSGNRVDDSELSLMQQFESKRLGKVSDLLQGRADGIDMDDPNALSDGLDTIPTNNVQSSDDEPLIWEAVTKQADEKVDSPPNKTKWEPKYQIGTRIINTTTRREGIILDISYITHQYIVQYEGDDHPEFATENEIATPDEFYKQLSDEVQDPNDKPLTTDEAKSINKGLLDILFPDKVGDTDQKKKDALDELRELLTDPEVAPTIVKKMLEKGLIDSQKALEILTKVGALPKSVRRTNNAKKR